MTNSASFISGFLLLFLVSCSSLDPALLAPTNDGIPERLLPLQVRFAGSVASPKRIDTSSVQPEFAIVYEAELNKNFFSDSKKKWGYIELRILHDTTQGTIGGGVLTVFNICTLGFPALLGVPYKVFHRTIQTEIYICDNMMGPMKKFTYTEDDTYSVGLYTRDEFRRSGINLMRAVISDLKKDLQPLTRRLNKALSIDGPID
jgi:hypothetical protein